MHYGWNVDEIANYAREYRTTADHFHITALRLFHTRSNFNFICMSKTSNHSLLYIDRLLNQVLHWKISTIIAYSSNTFSRWLKRLHRQFPNICGPQNSFKIPFQVWPGVQDLELYSKMELPMGHKRKVKDRLKAYVRDPFGCDLLDKLLQLDPKARYDADGALNHDFFWSDPMPCDLSKMLSHHLQSMFEYLAPPRRPGNMMRHYQQMNTSQVANRTQDNSYQDRVY